MRTLILAVALVLSPFPGMKACGKEQAPAGEPVAITIAVEFTSHAACAHIARSKGWFEKEGLNITAYDSYITGMTLASALVKGDIDVAYICLIPAINAFANAGVPVKIVCGTHLYGYGLLVDPEKIKTVNDLERDGIRIGCSREGSPLDCLLHKMIAKYGLDQDKILGNIRRMPPHRVLLAMKVGQLDAGFCCEQFPSMGEAIGFKVHLQAEDLWPRMPGSVVVAREEFIREHPEMVEKIVRITERAIGYINEHPEEAALIVSEALSLAGKQVLPLNVGKTAAGFQVTPDIILKSLTERMICSTDVDPEEIQNAINYSAGLEYLKKQCKAGELLDLRFLEKVKAGK